MDMVREDGVVVSINSNMSILYWNWLGAGSDELRQTLLLACLININTSVDFG